MSAETRSRNLETITGATRQIAALEREIIDAVIMLRMERATWREIAAALETTPSNAHRKYHRMIPSTLKGKTEK